MIEAEKITYEVLLKDLRDEREHRAHHLDKLERFVALVNKATFEHLKENNMREYSKREKDRLDLIDEMAEKAMNEATVRELTESYYDRQYCHFESMSQEDLISTAKQMGLYIEDTLLC